MKKLILNVIAVTLTVLGLGAIANMSPAYAANSFVCPDGSKKTGASYADACSSAYGESELQGDNLEGTITTIINVIVGVVGLIAVVMIVVGGIQFATSQGDAGKTTKAKNTILYGVVGLVVALLAFAIVNFVLVNVFA